METIEERIGHLIGWLDRGPNDPDIERALGLGLPLDRFRQDYIEARLCIAQHPDQFDWQHNYMSWFVLDSMNYFEQTALGQAVLRVNHDLYFMSYILGALRAAYALKQEGEHPMLPGVIAFLEEIRKLLGESWSREGIDLAPRCDAFRHFVAEHARDLYRRLGDDFGSLLAFSPSNDDHHMPRMYRP